MATWQQIQQIAQQGMDNRYKDIQNISQLSNINPQTEAGYALGKLIGNYIQRGRINNLRQDDSPAIHDDAITAAFNDPNGGGNPIENALKEQTGGNQLLSFNDNSNAVQEQPQQLLGNQLGGNAINDGINNYLKQNQTMMPATEVAKQIADTSQIQQPSSTVSNLQNQQ